MSDTINNRDEFRSKRRTKTFTVDLPDMGATIHVLKGTWALVGRLDSLEPEKLPERIAMLIVNADGEQMFTTPEDIQELRESMTLKDMSFVMEQWATENGVTKEAIERALKNSVASQNGVSVSA